MNRKRNEILKKKKELKNKEHTAHTVKVMTPKEIMILEEVEVTVKRRVFHYPNATNVIEFDIRKHNGIMERNKLATRVF